MTCIILITKPVFAIRTSPFYVLTFVTQTIFITLLATRNLHVYRNGHFVLSWSLEEIRLQYVS